MPSTSPVSGQPSPRWAMGAALAALVAAAVAAW
ncbi:MAG: hypothetical protein JWN32_2769, partial [Solirubrobacterales bacterium]|nr:hypothetical protein [Solirubrobacterales bacterium]